jgi:hypothetical protein
MVKFVPLSRQQHGDKTWKRPDTYQFAAHEALAPLVGREAGTAAVNMPMAFTKEGEGYQLVALLSFAPKTNLFVNDDGKWVGSYIPATFRSYPFRLLRVDGQDKMVLCIDEESEFIKDGPGDEIFFDGGNQASKAVTQIGEFLTQLEQSRQATAFAVGALAEAGVVAPWPIKVKTADKETPVTGVYRIDEKALNKLDTEQFEKLRKVGAVPLAYAQLISMARLEVLQRLAEFHQKRRDDPAAKNREAELDFLNPVQDDTLIF